MWWKRKSKPAAAAPVKQHDGFFSTNRPFGLTVAETDEALENAIKKSIQRTAADLKAHVTKNDGSVESMAMDEAYPDLQLVKAQNSFRNIVPTAQMIFFAEQAFIGYQAAALLAQHWLIDKACTMPARDAVRNGYDITANDGEKLDPEILNFIRERDKAFGIKNNCQELVRFGRIFGIRIAKFEVDYDDPTAYEKPFNIDGVKPGKYRGIAQIDPYWITPLLDSQAASNAGSRHFYEPTWWLVNGKKIHRSHLIICRNGDEQPDILKPTYFYGGIPIPQKIAERVYAAERTANEAPQLAMTKRLTVLKTDISQATANEASFTEKMTLWSTLMNNFGVKVVGDSEEIEQHDTTLNDLDAVIMTQYQLVAAAAEVPATKLMGTSPKGFGAAGNYEIESYHEFLESIQEHDITPLVDRHHALLMKSEVQPKFGVFIKTEIVWRPLDTPTALEQSDINLKKAQTGNYLVQSGAIDGTDERQRVVSEPESGYNGMPEIVPDGPGDREAQQEAEAALEQPVSANGKTKSGESA